MGTWIAKVYETKTKIKEMKAKTIKVKVNDSDQASVALRKKMLQIMK